MHVKVTVTGPAVAVRDVLLRLTTTGPSCVRTAGDTEIVTSFDDVGDTLQNTL